MSVHHVLYPTGLCMETKHTHTCTKYTSHMIHEKRGSTEHSTQFTTALTIVIKRWPDPAVTRCLKSLLLWVHPGEFPVDTGNHLNYMQHI